MILIVMIIILFELIQMLLSKRKVLRYILPIITYLFSLYIILGLIIYDIEESMKYRTFGLSNIISWIWLFFIFNIPTILFCVTNICMKKKEKKYIVAYIIINIILLIPIVNLV